MPRLEAIGVIVSDMARAVDFYSRVGLKFGGKSTDEVHAEAIGPGGLRVMLDTEASVMSFSEWQPPTVGGPRTALAFLCDNPGEVDRVYEELVTAGGRGHLPLPGASVTPRSTTTTATPSTYSPPSSRSLGLARTGIIPS
jgi:catechol 2,3-dioxygenase-like lactoylglutathione lyase family enzyme